MTAKDNRPTLTLDSGWIPVDYETTTPCEREARHTAAMAIRSLIGGRKEA